VENQRVVVPRSRVTAEGIIERRQIVGKGAKKGTQQGGGQSQVIWKSSLEDKTQGRVNILSGEGTISWRRPLKSDVLCEKIKLRES